MLFYARTRLTKEQHEKIDKKSSLESELKRLELIYDRLQHQERLLEKSSLVKKVVLNTNDMSIDITASVPVTECKEIPLDTTSVVGNQKAIPGVKSKAIQKAIPDVKSTEARHDVKSKAIHKAIPDVKSSAAEGIGKLMIELNTTESQQNSENHNEVSKVTISSFGSNGRTVLSPWKSSLVMPDTCKQSDCSSVELSVTPVKLNVPSPSIADDSKKQNSVNYKSSIRNHAESTSFINVKAEGPSFPRKTHEKSTIDVLASHGSKVTLASFIPKQVLEKKTSRSVNSKSFSWNKSSNASPVLSPIPADSSISLWFDSPAVIEKSSPNANIAVSKLPSKSLLEIQHEESIMNQQSKHNLLMTSSNKNPWFVDRRTKTESIQKVMNDQLLQRQIDESRKAEDYELQSALNAIREAEKSRTAEVKTVPPKFTGKKIIFTK